MRNFEFVERVMNIKDLRLPERSTKHSAGYDFFNPEKIELVPGEITYVKTGVKADMFSNEVLILANRSSNPMKKHVVLINGIRSNRR